jgi:thiol:disulfide interchange protein
MSEPLIQAPIPSFNWRNLIVALAAVLLAATLFFTTKQSQSNVSLEALAQSATEYEQAIANPKPTLIEFYADWCTSCQSMAADNLALQTKYRDRLNFVMLNVDNNKWLPEMERFNVDGIPHFVYLAEDNHTLGNTIGVLPKSIMASNLEAMLSNQPLPYTQTDLTKPQGATSPLTSPLNSPLSSKAELKNNQPQPMDHGA